MLAATTTVERNEISSTGTCSIDKVYAMKQIVAPQHGALDDYKIFRRLSAQLGIEYGFTEGKTQLDDVKDAYNASSASKDTPFDMFWAEGMARNPVHRLAVAGREDLLPALHVCHGPRDPGQFTEKQWLGIAPSMFQRIGLNDDEQKTVLEFRLKNAKH